MMKQIAPNIYVELDNLGSNNSFIVTNEGIVLIDAPHKPTDAVRWRNTIDTFGKAVYLIHTDHHIDHTLGNFFLEGTIISHDETRRKMKDHYASMSFIQDLLSVFDPEGLSLMTGYSLRLPTITFNDRMKLNVGGVTLELIHLKGHTPNSLIVYLPDQKVLFTGDNVCEAGLPSFHESCVASWFETIDYISTLDFEIFVPGHGEIGTKETVLEFRRQARELVQNIENAIRSGIPKEEIINQIRFQDNIHVSTDSYIGYPDHMIEEFQRKSIASIYDQITSNEVVQNVK
jgi:cyclase